MRIVHHFKQESEKEIQQAICLYLRMKRHIWWRQNNVGVYDQKKGIYRSNPNTLRGIPDIFVIDGHRILALEVKSSVGKLSPEQAQFDEMFHCPPCREYRIVRSVSDVIALGL